MPIPDVIHDIIRKATDHITIAFKFSGKAGDAIMVRIYNVDVEEEMRILQEEEAKAGIKFLSSGHYNNNSILY